ncbi:xylose isomerase [Actinobacteria bacterium YIM 96077]|uniref:Xylose isomerase n=1 Tax=Phytoactinopolyspora halophila TaxID=1981511 RepID=A0A329QMT3_9ACTN|nr:metabolite traffic protein EboE [Phytoactinopolyspora halophila]AYY14775.1 xylose isomerase [Actinobacteria bacterium YIM 96077]RAW13049.1 xylose isomerase [Phytoactinopolyspora halophila]
MRFRHRDGTVVHLAYCTNVHPTENLDGLVDQVQRFGGGVRRHLGVERLGLGLWLPAPVASRLAHHGDLDRLRTTLARNGLEVVTLNAFPYAGFHDAEVKKAVYRPDWSEPQRLAYTLDCASVLARLMPDDAARGSISTLPLGWRAWWSDDHQRRASEHLDRLADGLAKVEADTGREIRVGLEPEPGCAIETASDAVDHLDGLGADRLERIGICLDACHLASEFDDPCDAVARLAGAGLPVVKTQASAALHAGEPGDTRTREALLAYAEDRFLHQTREIVDGHVTRRDDLPEALDGDRRLPGRGPWRVHFHVPLHEHPAAPLEGTQDELHETLVTLLGGASAITDHVEVETYTWSVLPPGRRPDGEAGLITGLAGELRWVADRLEQLGMEAL